MGGRKSQELSHINYTEILKKCLAAVCTFWPSIGLPLSRAQQVAPVQGTASCPCPGHSKFPTPPPPISFFLFNLPFTVPPKLPLVWLAVNRKPLFSIFQKTSCQCSGSVSFWYRSASADPYHWITDTDLVLFFSGFHDAYYPVPVPNNVGTFTSVFKDTSYSEVTKL